MLKVIRTGKIEEEEKSAMVDYIAPGVIIDEDGEFVSDCIIGYDGWDEVTKADFYYLIATYLFIKGEFAETIDLVYAGPDYHVENEELYINPDNDEQDGI